jgi:hypothetical protein
MSHSKALPEPDPVKGSPEDGTVLEVARVWINQGQPSIIVSPAYNDPRMMGMMLAELCWNFAWAYSQKDGTTQKEALDALKEGWVQGHLNGEAHAASKS